MMVSMRIAAPTAADARLYSGGRAPPDAARYSCSVMSAATDTSAGVVIPVTSPGGADAV